MGFAENLVRMRKQRGWSQIDLGIKADINPKTLSSYENGRTEPSLGEVVKLCKAFDCSIAYLTDTKERELGDVSIEDIMLKLATLDRKELEKLKEHIKILIRNQDEIMRMTIERKKMEEEKKELEYKIKEYDELIKLMNTENIKKG